MHYLPFLSDDYDEEEELFKMHMEDARKIQVTPEEDMYKELLEEIGDPFPLSDPEDVNGIYECF